MHAGTGRCNKLEETGQSMEGLKKASKVKLSPMHSSKMNNTKAFGTIYIQVVTGTELSWGGLGLAKPACSVPSAHVAASPRSEPELKGRVFSVRVLKEINALGFPVAFSVVKDLHAVGVYLNMNIVESDTGDKRDTLERGPRPGPFGIFIRPGAALFKAWSSLLALQRQVSLQRGHPNCYPCAGWGVPARVFSLVLVAFVFISVGLGWSKKGTYTCKIQFRDTTVHECFKAAIVRKESAADARFVLFCSRRNSF